VSHEEEATIPSKQVELVHPYLELHLLLADGGEYWIQFERGQFSLAQYLPEGLHWSVCLLGERVRLSSSGPSARFQGALVQEVTLSVGDCIELGQHRIWLVDARMPEVARLETCPGPDRARSWSLKPQAYRLGRHGQARLNHIELNHPTVSRAQATLLPLSAGHFCLLAESESSPTRLNGNLIAVGQIQRLQHGDLIQVGEISLRFRQSRPILESGGGLGSPSTSRLTVQSLGGFSLHWGDRSWTEACWKSAKARVLIARLALAWGQPLAVESLIEMLWPEHPAPRGRKNLSQCLGELKATLELSDESELLLRTPATIHLQLEVLGEHDLITFRQLALGQEVGGWSKALQLYRGPYLPSFFEEWAQTARQDLQRLAVETSLKLTQSLFLQEQFEQAMLIARRGLGWEPCHQALALLFMNSAIRIQRPEEAIRCFDSLREQLQRNFDMEPNTELVRAQLVARGRML